MTLGQFHLTGKVQQATKDSVDAGIDQDITVATGWTATLTSSYPRGVPLPDGSDIDYIDVRTVVLLSDGSISEDGVTAGISLTANDPAEFATPLQWTIKPGTVTLTSGKTLRPKAWTFNAPLAGAAVTLGGLTPVVGIPLQPAPGATPWDSVTGKPLVIAAGSTQAEARASIGISGSGGDWEPYANFAAFPVTGNTALEYLALDTNKIYKWSGSAYVLSAQLVQSTEITDSTATGRAVLTAASATTGRAALSAAPLLGGIYYVDNYGADPTGVGFSDTAVAAARTAMGSNPGVLVFGAGTYNLASPISPFIQQQSVRGQGMGSTRIVFTGTGDLIRARDTAVYNGVYFGPTAGGPRQGGSFRGFWVDGNGAGVGSSGLHIGDMAAPIVEDVRIDGFNKTGSIGVWFDNNLTWSERIHAQFLVADCTIGICFDSNPGTGAVGTASFDYSWFDVSVWSQVNQDGVVMRNGVNLWGVDFSMVGNFRGGGGANTGSVFVLGKDNTDYAIFGAGATLHIAVETGGSGTGHKTFNCSTDARTLIAGEGNIQFTAAAMAFTAGNAAGKIAFTGVLNVDANLGKRGYWQAGRDVGFRGGSKAFLASTGGTLFLATGNTFITQLTAGAQTITGIDTDSTAKANTGETGSWEIFLRQPSSGSATLTWPGSFVWLDGGAAPVLSTTPNAFDHVRVVTHDFVTFYGRHVNNMTAALALKANLASPTFTGTVTVPTPTVASAAATKAYVDAATGATVYMPAPSGDITGVTDAANLVTAQAKLPAGVGAIVWGNGTYWLTGNNDIVSQQHWYGQGISATTLRLARSQSTNLVRTKNFETYKVSDTVKTFGIAATYVTATITGATTVFLSNVITAASTTGAVVGDIIVAPGFNPGAYITAVTATTITVNLYCNFGGTVTVFCSSLPTQFGFHDLTLDGNGLVGGQSGNKIVSPPAGLTVTPTGATGSTTYSYRVSGVNSIGETQSSAPISISNGNATLNGTNYNAVSWSTLAGVTSYNVYAGFGTNEHWIANVAAGTTTYNHQAALSSSFATGQFYPVSNTTAGRVLAVCGYGWSMSNVDIRNGCGLGIDMQLSGTGSTIDFGIDFTVLLTDVHMLGNAGGGVRIMGQTDSFWSGATFIANGFTGGSAPTNGMAALDVQSAGWSFSNTHIWGGGVQTGVRLAGQLCTFTGSTFEDGHDYLVQILGRANVIESSVFYNTASNDPGCIAFYDSGVNNRIQANGRDVRNGVLKLGIATNGALPPTPTSYYDFIMAYEVYAPPATLLYGTLDSSVNYQLRLNNRNSGNTTTVTTQGMWVLRLVAKTANYTLASGEFVEADATSGALTMTLPTAPPHGTRCGGKKMDGSATVPGNAVSFATGGSDKFNTTAGGTTFSLSQANQAFTVQYDSSTSCWVVLSTDFPKGVADALYEAKVNKDAASGYAGLNASSQLTKDTLGNAATATKWATARTINGISVDGTGNVVVWSRSIVSVTTSTTLGAAANTDYVVLIGAGGTPTLPTAVGNTNRYTLKNVDTAAHSALTTSSQTIEGVTTYSLAGGDSIEVISDGSNWKVI